MKTTFLTVNGKRAEVLGQFGKGTPGSVALNFSTSGGDNCDRGCAYHPESTSKSAAPDAARCYAVACEKRHDRANLRGKLERHESAGADAVLSMAWHEMALRAWRVPWFRFSAFGSLPARVPAGLRKFVAQLKKAGTPVHLPIETARKATRYRNALGDLVTVRESVANPRRWREASGPCSIVAGSMEQRPAERIETARELATIRREKTGRKVTICPAIVSTFNKSPNRVKCGQCTKCADPDVDIVYPVHR